MAAKVNLYTIATEYQQLMNKIMDQDGVLDDEDQMALALSENNLQAKAESYIGLIGQLEAESEMIMARAMELRKVADSRKKLAERLRSNLAAAMVATDKQKLDFTTQSVSLRFSEALELSEDFLIPDQFKKVKVEADKAGIKAAIKKGESFEGAHIAKNPYLIIK